MLIPFVTIIITINPLKEKYANFPYVLFHYINCSSHHPNWTTPNRTSA